MPRSVRRARYYHRLSPSLHYMIHGDLPLVGSLYIIPLRSIDKLFPGALRMAVSLHSTAPRLSYPMAHITVRCHAINASLSPTPPPSAQSSWRTVDPSVRLCRWAAPGFVRLLRRRPRSSRLSLLLHKHLPGCALCCSPMLLRRIRYSMGHGRPPDDCSVAMTLRVRAVSIDSSKPLTHWHGLTASAPRTITITPSHLPPKGREVCQA